MRTASSAFAVLSSSLVILVLCVLRVEAAEAADAPTQAPAGERPFAMGFTPFPPDTTPEAVEETYRFIGENGDLIVHHFDNGVAWTEALEGKPFHPNLEGDWHRRVEASKGKKVFLALTPLDSGRKGMALSRGSGDNQPIPEGFLGKAFDDPDVRKAYLEWCRRAVDRLHPDWLAIGIEVNELILNSPGAWPAFLTLYRETRAALKKEHPKLPICATVTLHGLLDPPKKNRNGQTEKVRAFLEECDFAGMSYYSFLMGNMTRPEIALDALAGLTTKPVAIVETGFPAETVRMETFKLVLPSSPELQEAYVEKLLERAGRDRHLFVAWFLHQDYDRMWEKIRATMPEFFVAWKDCGLLDGDGKARPALAVWKRTLARRRR